MDEADAVAAFSTEGANAYEAFSRDLAAVSAEVSRVTTGVEDAM
jgi:hypothetical protein